MDFYTKLHSGALKAIQSGKSFTHKQSTHNAGEHLAKISFNAKKHLNKIQKSFASGKGVRISPSMYSKIQLSRDGGSIFSDISDGFKSVGKTILAPVAKAVIPPAAGMLGTAAGSMIGQPVLGGIGASAAGKAIADQIPTGKGLKRVRLAKQVLPIVRHGGDLSSGLSEVDLSYGLGGRRKALLSENSHKGGSYISTTGGSFVSSTGGSFSASVRI